MNSISEFDNGLDDDLDNCWDDKSIGSDDSVDYESPTAKVEKISTTGVVKKGLVKKNTKLSALKKEKLVAKVPPNEKTKVKIESIGEFDNGLDDDLDNSWLNEAADSDDSRDYEAQAVKKIKTSSAMMAKKAPIKKTIKGIQETAKTAAKIASGSSKIVPSKSVAKLTVESTEHPSDSIKLGNTGEISYPLEQFDLTASTVLLLRDRGIESLFPIQAETYWPIRAGKDLIGRARTGQGDFIGIFVRKFSFSKSASKKIILKRLFLKCS